MLHRCQLVQLLSVEDMDRLTKFARTCKWPTYDWLFRGLILALAFWPQEMAAGRIEKNVERLKQWYRLAFNEEPQQWTPVVYDCPVVGDHDH
jgi:hypothetical protein